MFKHRLEEYIRLCTRSVIIPSKDIHISFRSRDEEDDYKICYELCKYVNDDGEAWEEFDTSNTLSLYDREEKFIGFVKIFYNIPLDAFSVNVYTHPQRTFDTFSEITLAIFYLFTYSSYFLSEGKVNYFYNVGSQRILNSLLAVNPYLKVVKIYDRYIVLYTSVTREEAKDYLLTHNILEEDLEFKFLEAYNFNAYKNNYDYKSIIKEEILSLFDEVVNIFDEKEEFLGFIGVDYIKATSEINVKLFNLNGNFFNYLTEAFQKLLNIKGYVHLELVVFGEDKALILKSNFNLDVHKISENYFICHKELVNEKI